MQQRGLDGSGPRDVAAKYGSESGEVVTIVPTIGFTDETVEYNVGGQNEQDPPSKTWPLPGNSRSDRRR